MILYSAPIYDLNEATERLERVQREMEETRRQRKVLQSDLERHESHENGGNSEGPGGSSDSDVGRLRHQIEQLSRRIGELETERREDAEQHAPPDYYSPGPDSLCQLVPEQC